jgi:hypothetical protein
LLVFAKQQPVVETQWGTALQQKNGLVPQQNQQAPHFWVRLV